MTTPPLPRPNYTLTDAAALVGVSRSTIRRRREQGKFPDAYKTRDGEWMVPLTNLLADGLRPSSSEHVHAEQVRSVEGTVTLTPLAQAAHSLAQNDQAHLQERLQLAERDLAVERAKSEGLTNTLAATQARANDLSLALRMLETGRPKGAEAHAPIPMGPAVKPEPDLDPEEGRGSEATPPPKKRWWKL